ncbi:MAG TPA: delta-60 repeat domain-containing protein, partial [Actinomycetota bacterium]|nr:delta-60 repeat domain-containing protein [Actinomycetota bacterium]
ARDTDIAAVRFSDDGTLDTEFGENGIARFDLGTGRPVEDNFVGDTMYGLTLLEDDQLLLVGAKLHDGPDETDRDFAILRLTQDGQPDSEFGTEGTFVLDINDGNESPRQALQLEDGTVVVSGYSGVGDGPISPVLFKLDDGGELITDFGDEGIATAEMLPGVAEAYEVGLQGDAFIISGYGRATDDEKVDLIAARFTAEGEWDKEFGEDGLVRVDISGQDDRGRDLVVLEDGNILVAGSGKPSETDINAMLVMLTEDGELDETFGRDGIYQVDLGGRTDSFFSIALSEDESSAVVAGWMGPDAAAGGNEESVIARILL